MAPRSQHGFSHGRSTVTALLPLATKVAVGFNQPKPPSRTVVAAVDLTKAFDCVDHTLLLRDLASTSLPPNLLRWLSTFLRGHTCRVTYQGYKLAPRNSHAGVPKGGVLSLDLFNFFVRDQPTSAETHEAYADDSYDAESTVKIDEAAV